MIRAIAAAVAATLLAGFAPQTASVLPDVDVELILMADVSLSMDGAELNRQRQGYIAAMRSPEVAEAILEGAAGRVAVAYVEWSSQSNQDVVVGWTIISDAAGAAAFADRLEAAPLAKGVRNQTSVSAAITFAHGQIRDNGISAERSVIDVGGDGKDNDSRVATATVRDLAVADGVTINGLPVAGDTGESGLTEWYRDNVVGGFGSFLIPVEGFENFASAVRRKLVLEIAGREPETRFAAGIPVIKVE